MSVILEEDIIQAYINNEIDEYDVLGFYQEGYISDNTMDLLIDEDDYISEAVDELAYEMEALEEGMISRGINNIRAALTSDKAKKEDLYLKNFRDARADKNKSALGHYKKKIQDIRYGTQGKQALLKTKLENQKERSGLKDKLDKANEKHKKAEEQIKDKAKTIKDLKSSLEVEKTIGDHGWNLAAAQHEELQKEKNKSLYTHAKEKLSKAFFYRS